MARAKQYADRVNVIKRIKVNGRWPFAPVLERNGRIVRDHVWVSGREEHHPEGRYYLEWYQGGKRRRQAIASFDQVAEAARKKSIELDALGAGILPSIEVPAVLALERRTIVAAIEDYLDYVKKRRSLRTCRTYRPTLSVVLRNSYTKTYVDEATRDDILPFFDWQHETSPEDLARNQEGLRQVAPMLGISQAVGSEYAEKVGLTIDWTDPFATISKLAWLTQTPKAFDFKSSHWPSQFHHTGSFHDGFGRIDPDFPWDRLTGEPLIYASMGTLQNGLEPVFSTISEAVEKSGAEMQLVLSIGPGLDPRQIRSLPANAIVTHHAPQLELLKRSALCITHAGLNTTLESLAQGVPLVAIPVTNDQPGVAARIAYTKTGAYVPLAELTSPRLSSLIDEVTTNPLYRQNATDMKQEIVKANGLEKAADLLEEAFRLRSAR